MPIVAHDSEQCVHIVRSWFLFQHQADGINRTEDTQMPQNRAPPFCNSIDIRPQFNETPCFFRIICQVQSREPAHIPGIHICLAPQSRLPLCIIAPIELSFPLYGHDGQPEP